MPARAEVYTEPSTPLALCEALDWARAEGLRVTPIGEGSNLVLAGDVAGLVVRPMLRGISVVARDDATVTLRVAAGENWHAFVAGCLEEGYYGLENLALIPGTVGAAPIQNIGAYGVELESFVVAVHAIAIDNGEEVTLAAERCEFSYRDSVFKRALRDQVVITSVDLRLPLQPCVDTRYPSLAAHLSEQGIAAPTPRDVFAAVVAIRSARLPDPAQIPNAGSFFKNPVVDAAIATALQSRFPDMPLFAAGEGGSKLSAAWFIDQCGWKGQREGGVGVHEHHALVLVHRGGATGADLLELAARIQESVAHTFGIDLEIEPRVYGGAP